MSLRPGGDPRPRLRRRGAADRLRTDDLAAVHGRAHLRGAVAAGERACWTSARDRVTRRPCWRSSAHEVHTIERIPELTEIARANLAAAGYGERVHCHVGDGTLGLPQHAPFEAIAVAAAAPRVPADATSSCSPAAASSFRSAAAAGSSSSSRSEPRRSSDPALSSVPLRAAGGRGGLRRGVTRALVQIRGASREWPAIPSSPARGRSGSAAGSGTERTAPSRPRSKGTKSGSARWSTGAAAARRAPRSGRSTSSGRSRRGESVFRVRWTRRSHLAPAASARRPSSGLR